MTQMEKIGEGGCKVVWLGEQLFWHAGLNRSGFRCLGYEYQGSSLLVLMCPGRDLKLHQA